MNIYVLVKKTYNRGVFSQVISASTSVDVLKRKTNLPTYMENSQEYQEQSNDLSKYETSHCIIKEYAE